MSQTGSDAAGRAATISPPLLTLVSIAGRVLLDPRRRYWPSGSRMTPASMAARLANLYMTAAQHSANQGETIPAAIGAHRGGVAQVSNNKCSVIINGVHHL